VLSCGLLKGFELSIIIIFDYCNRRESWLASCHVAILIYNLMYVLVHKCILKAIISYVLGGAIKLSPSTKEDKISHVVRVWS